MGIKIPIVPTSIFSSYMALLKTMIFNFHKVTSTLMTPTMPLSLTPSLVMTPLLVKDFKAQFSKPDKTTRSEKITETSSFLPDPHGQRN